MSTLPAATLTEHAYIKPVPHRVAWLIVIVLALLVIGSGTGAFLVYGDRIYYRQWTSVRTWSRPVDDVDLRREGGLESHGRRYLWYAAMHRSAQRSIRMKTHNDFSLGMVLVVLPREGSDISQGKGGQAWYMSESVTAPGRRTAMRELVVETKLVRVGAETFMAQDGRLVLIDGQGNASQHSFETGAQSAAQMQAVVEEFLAKLATNQRQ
jgi:hypothetical protein